MACGGSALGFGRSKSLLVTKPQTFLATFLTSLTNLPKIHFEVEWWSSSYTSEKQIPGLRFNTDSDVVVPISLDAAATVMTSPPP